MAINLLTESMLGHWRAPSGVWLCEFQFGSRLIYVEHRNGESPDRRLAAAQRLVNAAWEDLPQALMFAEKQCEGCVSVMSPRNLLFFASVRLPPFTRRVASNERKGSFDPIQPRRRLRLQDIASSA